jgi:hypothetical protein
MGAQNSFAPAFVSTTGYWKCLANRARHKNFNVIETGLEMPAGLQ